MACLTSLESLDRSRIFVTTPRFQPGVPVTLGYVQSQASSVLIQPYPDYSWHSSNGANCDGLTSVFRVAIDRCNQLWVLDSGVIGTTRKCPPQLVVFNLRTDKLVKRYKFPKEQYKEDSLFITPVRHDKCGKILISIFTLFSCFLFPIELNQILDTKDPAPNGRCSDTKVYIADVTAFALIVYDSVTNKSWKIQNKLVHHRCLTFPSHLHFNFLSLFSSTTFTVLSIPKFWNVHNCWRVFWLDGWLIRISTFTKKIYWRQHECCFGNV